MSRARYFHLAFLASFLALTCLPVAAQVAPAAGNSLSYGFVVDNSGSHRVFLERVIAVVRGVVELNASDDETFLVTFVDKTKTFVRQEFTGDKAEIVDAAENMFIEGGGSTVLDSLRFSIDYFSANAKERAERRRAILLITDGDDRGSTTKIETVIAAAKNSGIRIVVLGLSDEKVNTKMLDRLAKETGGRAFYPKIPRETTAAIPEMAAALRGN